VREPLSPLSQSHATAVTRRSVLRAAATLPFGLLPFFPTRQCVAASSTSALRDRVHGMLLGAAIGDAVGGPVEFQSYQSVRSVLPDCRAWATDRVMNAAEIERLAADLPLLSYERWRPKAEPYGQWSDDAPAGTVTDDTRHKMVFISAVRRSMRQSAQQSVAGAGTAVSRAALVKEYASINLVREFGDPRYADLREESFREFSLAANFELGKLDQAFPPERIWGGLPTCCGQMILTPLAAIHAGEPVAAYRAAFELGFMDQGTAKDTNSAIVAGLSKALVLDAGLSLDQAFAGVRKTLLETDPYRYHDVPFIERPIKRWMDHAEQCEADCAGRPGVLYDCLKQTLQPFYFWEARFTFGAAWALLKHCRWNGLAAMHLAMDLGHDTDSVAQLIGQFYGAIKGAGAFPERLRQPVIKRLKADYGVSLDDWTELLLAGASGRKGKG